MLQKVAPNSSIGDNPFPTTCAVPGDVNPTFKPHVPFPMYINQH